MPTSASSATTVRERLQAMLDSIAYVQRHGMIVDRIDQTGDVVVRLPDSPDNLNIAGSLHASALFCVAETAAGVAAWCIESDPATMVYVRCVEVEYTRRVSGEVTAAARVTDVSGDDATVAVTVADSGGRVVMNAAFSYALRRASGSPRTPAA